MWQDQATGGASLAPTTAPHFKGHPSREERGKRLTRGNVWLSDGQMSEIFFGQLPTIQLFIGSSC